MMTATTTLIAATAFVLSSQPAAARQAPMPAPPAAPASPATAAPPQAPVPPAPAARAARPRGFDLDFDLDFDVDLDFDFDVDMGDQVAALTEQALAAADHARLRIDRDSVRELAQQMSRLGQVPVPPVPPVPRGPRQNERDRRRPRYPEGWVEATEPFTRTVNVGKGAALLLSNVAGNIQVTPGNADRIEIEAVKHAWGPTAEQAKARLADTSVEVYPSGNRVEVRVEQNGRNDRSFDVELNVKVPADAAVDLRTVSGDVRVTNVKGEVRVQGISGNMFLEGTARLAAARTVSGNISLTNAGSDTQLSLATVNGDLQINSLNARSIDVNTVNGDIRIASWSGDRAHVRSLDGDVDLQTTLVKGGRYELESHSGNVVLSLPEQPGFELEANTFGGRIRVDFPIKSEGPIRDNDRGPRSIRGVYGDASSSLRLQTFSGNVTVTRR